MYKDTLIDVTVVFVVVFFFWGGGGGGAVYLWENNVYTSPYCQWW